MEYLLLVITIFFSSVQSIISKQYNIKSKKSNTFIYASAVSFFAMLFFIFSSGGKLEFNADIIFYSVTFAIAYGMALFGGTNAIRTGPLSITALISQCSLILPTLFGIVILKDNIEIYAYAGIIFLFVALILVNLKNEKMKFSPSWFFWVIISFFGNGMCSIVQKIQQMNFNGKYKSEFMIIALLIVTLITFIAGCKKSSEIKATVAECIKYAPFQGVANGIVNLLVMLLTALLPTALLFPSISAGGMVIMFVISLKIYEEKLSMMQTIGYLFGIISVILLNL